MRISEDAYPAMPCEWVIATYSGDKAKYIKGLVNEGIGYFILKEETGTIVAASRRALDRPRPHGVEPVTNPAQIEKLEKMRKDRQGLR